jgi:hypothetical protein
MKEFMCFESSEIVSIFSNEDLSGAIMKYQIIVKGKLDKSWSDWLDGASVSSELDEDGLMITRLIVQATDQPALFGILNRIRDMNLLPISVERIGKEK